MKITRFVSANVKQRFNSEPDYWRQLAADLYTLCECDGRGCTICIAAEQLIEAARQAEASAPEGATRDGNR
jgi:hypothetical protein